MKEIRLWYTQPGPGDYTDRFLTPLLSRRYKIVLNPCEPDYVISSCGRATGRSYHFDHPDAVKIFYAGENVAPDFNLFDYGIGFHYIDFGDRYLRYPLWLFYLGAMGTARCLPPDAAAASERKFCNFVYSNQKHGDPVRSELFRKLSAYRNVDSGGAFLNNLGYRVADKPEFLKGYKFTIAAENSSAEGYTTEKLIEPLMRGSMPVYWGDPAIENSEFDTAAFVVVKDIDAAVEEVRRLDNDSDAYYEKLSGTIFRDGSPAEVLAGYEERLLDFFGNIFERSKQEAYRRPRYGFNKTLTRNAERMQRTADSWWFGKWHGLKDKLKL